MEYLLGIYRLDSIHMCFMITALTLWSPPNMVNVPFWNSLDIIFGCVEAVFLFQTSLSCLMKCLKHKPYLLQGPAHHHLIYSPPKCKNTHAYSYIAFTVHKLVKVMHFGRNVCVDMSESKPCILRNPLQLWKKLKQASMPATPLPPPKEKPLPLIHSQSKWCPKFLSLASSVH